jgi:hypothetical protein
MGKIDQNPILLQINPIVALKLNQNIKQKDKLNELKVKPSKSGQQVLQVKLQSCLTTLIKFIIHFLN